MINGDYGGVGVPCAPEPAVGACCVHFGCITISQCICIINNGTFAGTGVPCSPDPCSACTILGDVNSDGSINGDDIPGYVRAKLSLPPAPGEIADCADYGSGALDGDTAPFVLDLLGSR